MQFQKVYYDSPAGGRWFGEPLTESIWLEPYPDAQLEVVATMLGPAARYEQRESIELTFAATFQHLPGRQRAVLILRDVLGFSAWETAGARRRRTHEDRLAAQTR